ncbi:MAG: MFS transporter [Chloroflexi bacterium]|nr:MFS transporter [Chloroflexota bacterium]
MMKEETVKDSKRWGAAAFLCLAVIILGMDDSVLNLALPSISREFNASTSDMQWAINAYLLAFAALLLTMGALGDRFGRKLMFLVGMVLFCVSSLAAALSTSMIMLILCRAFMGIGGAIAIPQTLSIITATFTDLKERTQAIALWAGVFGFGYGIGPVVGGVLLNHFAWNSVFIINIPLAMIAFAGGYFFARESRDQSAPRLDPPGVLLSTAGLFAIAYGITEAGRLTWTEGSVILWLGMGAVLLFFFVAWERRTDHPMLPMKFFKNMSFTGATIPMTLAALSSGALLFFLSQYLQSVQGYSPLSAAVRILPGAVFTLLVAMVAAPVSNRIGIKLTVALGALIIAGGLFWFSLVTPGTAYPVILGANVAIGAGFGLIWSPAANSVMGSLPLGRVGIGSALDATAQQVGGVLGVAALGAVLNGIYLDKIANLNVVASLPAEAYEAMRSSIQGAHIVAEQFPDEISQQIIDGSSEAFTSGMVEAMFIGGIIMVATTVITLLILPTRIRPTQE